MLWQNNLYTLTFGWSVFWNELAGAQSNLTNILKVHIFSPWNSISKNFKKNQKTAPWF